MRRTLLLSLWLPVGVAALGLLRFGALPGLFSAPALLGLVAAWPGGVPLTAALQRLHARSRPAAVACAALLGPLTVLAATVGGLFGPPGIWIYAGVVSLPAWLVLWFLQWRARRPAAPAGSGPAL